MTLLSCPQYSLDMSPNLSQSLIPFHVSVPICFNIYLCPASLKTKCKIDTKVIELKNCYSDSYPNRCVLSIPVNFLQIHCHFFAIDASIGVKHVNLYFTDKTVPFNKNCLSTVIRLSIGM